MGNSLNKVRGERRTKTIFHGKILTSTNQSAIPPMETKDLRRVRIQPGAGLCNIINRVSAFKELIKLLWAKLCPPHTHPFHTQKSEPSVPQTVTACRERARKELIKLRKLIRVGGP